MEDVAELAGVSRALVSLVMRDAPNVSDARRSAVLDAAAQLGYRPNVLARNLASRHTMTLGVMINDLHNPFFAEVVDGLQARADEAGYQLLLSTGGTTKSGETGAIESLLRFRVDGLILAGPRLPTGDITQAAATTPTVLIGRSVRSRAVDAVINDETVGARLAVEHLATLGHRRIAHISGGSGAGAPQRRAGYERAMADHGLEASTMVFSGDFTELSGVVGTGALLDADDPPTAIFAANDLVAAGALAHAEEQGLRVPVDLSIVGYDNSAIAAMHHMSLTTVHQPREEMGRFAVDLLLERLDGSRATAVRHVVTPSFIDRSSTAPPRTHSRTKGTA